MPTRTGVAGSTPSAAFRSSTVPPRHWNWSTARPSYETSTCAVSPNPRVNRYDRSTGPPRTSRGSATAA